MILPEPKNKSIHDPFKNDEHLQCVKFAARVLKPETYVHGPSIILPADISIPSLIKL